MSEAAASSKRVLDPIDRVSEVLFGLIMVLTFTGSLSVVESGRAEVKTMLLGALGCNLIWGIIDGVFYLMGCLAEESRAVLTFRALRRTGDPQEARRILTAALPPVIASVMQPAELETISQRLKKVPDVAERARLSMDSWLGAVGVFLLVFLSTLPVVIPFTFMKDISLALRVSNAIAIAMLFLAGYAFGRITGRRPVVVAALMVVIGLVLVSAAIALEDDDAANYESRDTLCRGGNPMDKEQGKQAWDDLMAKLSKERDELALKMHLGKMEAKAEWEKLEAKWNHLRTVKGPPLKDAAAETARGIGSALDQAADELKKGYEKIRKLL